jgi:hypothetical protein
MSSARLVFGTALLLFGIAPLLLGIAGWWRARREPALAQPAAESANAPHKDAPDKLDAAFPLACLLTYVLAFNLTFFVQELFLVLPKAFTPGLRPTLYHNNHGWQGDNPLAALYQGTGALATVCLALLCVLLLCRRATSGTARLLLIWIAYCGFFMALPQVAIAALSSGSDVGMAFAYLQLSAPAKLLAGVIALALLPPVALWLLRELFACADVPLAGARDRRRFVWRCATVPAFAALPLIVLFRMPREWLEVLFLPVVVTWFGIVWMQAGAWLVQPRTQGTVAATRWPVRTLVLAVLVLLLVFQFVLRPGIRFY